MTDPVGPVPTGEPVGTDDPAGPTVRAVLRVCVTITLFAAVLGAIVVARDVVVLVLVSLILALGLQRPVAWIEGRGVSRGLAIGLIAFVVFALIGLFIAFTVPSVTHEATALAKEAPRYLDRLQRAKWVRDLDSRFDLTKRVGRLGDNLPDVWTVGQSLISAIADGLTILVLTIYFAVDLPRLRDGIVSLMPIHRRARVEAILLKATTRVGGYVTGNLVVSGFAGVTSFIALLVLGVPYAAALAVWVALTDLIPAVGALLGAAVAIAVAAFTSPTAAIGTAIFFLVYQQIENYLVVPKIMRGAIDMSVGAVIIAVLIGAALDGFVGVLLSLPVAATIRIVIDELFLIDHRREVEAAEILERREQGRVRRLGQQRSIDAR